jgi:hypothetical protein
MEFFLEMIPPSDSGTMTVKSVLSVSVRCGAEKIPES